jgi:hypothetical protein
MANGMPAPSESKIVAKILDALRKLPGMWCFKTHGGPMQAAGLPDVMGIYNGRGFGLEVKRPGNKPTPIQLAMMEKIAAAGGLVAVVHSPEEALAALEGK